MSVCSRRLAPRLPFEPLLEVLGPRALEAMARDNLDVPLDRPHKTVMGRLLGIPHRQLYRFMQYGVTHDQADQLAVALGLHPLNVWPDWT